MTRRELFGTAAAAASAAALLAPEDAPAAAARRPLLDPTLPNYVRTADNVALFYRDWGHGKPVLFIHGWAAPSDMWNYQMPALSRQGLRCIAYDRRGHGRSSDPGGGYDYDTLSDDLAAVIEALDLHGVTLVGHSMAAGEMVRYLTRHGAGRIAKLVFLAPAATPYPLKTADNPAGIDGAFFEHFRNEILTHDLPKWIEENTRPFFTPETSPAMMEWAKSLMYQTSMQAIIECNRCGTTTDFRAELPKITVPTLVIHGDRDASAPLDLTGRPTAALIPGAKLVVYEGAPHGLMLTHVDRLNTDLIGFVGV
jgi:non-heme chloroperoxidase